MRPSPDSRDDDSDARLLRFTSGERWIHRTLGALFLVLIVTGSMLYFDFLSTAVGHRELISTIHFFAGLALPIPIIAGFALSVGFRDDARRLNRFHPRDWLWLKSSDRRLGTIPVGKFNAGQKLNAAFVVGVVCLMLATGLMLRYFGFFGDNTRTGATFVHDLVAFALVIVTVGHLGKAWADPQARVGMRTGWVTREWALEEHPLWVAEVTGTVGGALPEQAASDPSGD